MIGVQAYNCGAFHPQCKEVRPVDIGGFMWLWCGDCRVFCNLQAVAPKFQDYSAPLRRIAREVPV